MNNNGALMVKYCSSGEDVLLQYCHHFEEMRGNTGLSPGQSDYLKGKNCILLTFPGPSTYLLLSTSFVNTP